MGNEDKQLEQNKREEPLSLLSRSLITGFVGGLVFGFLGIVLYFFNFSEVTPKSYLLRSWITAEWTDRWLGNALSVVMTGLLSIGVAFVYYIFFKKIENFLMGAVYGVILWGIVFYLLQPVFPNIPPLTDLNMYTIVSTICLYILYGTFVGYSISYDYNDTLHQLKDNEAQN
ncbi:YqhR family membrane protein [Lentibacillus juripiscarius]|uniref:YqhR family membrane protein n=1 Tax=Lentibacillus juripiscarius TaxID=257446 RepID=A0ABW5V075_9BACI